MKLPEWASHPVSVAVVAAFVTSMLGNCAAFVAQRGALELADRQDRREMALELVRSKDPKRALETLDFLADAGLSIDQGGHLRDALRTPRNVIPVAVACIDRADIPPETEKPKLTGDASQDSAILLDTALKLRDESTHLRALMAGCVDE